MLEIYIFNTKNKIFINTVLLNKSEKNNYDFRFQLF